MNGSTIPENHNGKIEFGEFCKMMNSRGKVDEEEAMNDAFKSFDKDGSGFIERDELVKVTTVDGH